MKNELPSVNNSEIKKPLEPEAVTTKKTVSKEQPPQERPAWVAGPDNTVNDVIRQLRNQREEQQLKEVRDSLGLSGNETQSEKQKIWDEKQKEIEQITDANGKPIEAGIIKTIVALNILGINTSQSCAGHNNLEGGRLWPWVEISAPNEPEERFEGESQLFEDVAKKNKVNVLDLKRGHPEELFWEVKKRASQNPESEGYKRWEDKNRELYKFTQALLNKFYKDRKVQDDIVLKLDEDNGGSFEISSEKDALLKLINGDLTDEEKANLIKKLAKRREEMKLFTKFLKYAFFTLNTLKMENIENQERDLKEKLLSFQIKYCDKLWKKEIPFPDGNIEQMTFENIMNRYSDISGEIHNVYVKRTGKVPFGKDEEFEEISNKILMEIHRTYDESSTTQPEPILSIIDNVIKTLPENQIDEKSEDEREILRVGLLRYEIRPGLRGLEGLAQSGIKEEDECIMIHLDPLYKQKASGVTESLSESFEKLAEKIVTQYPQIKAVIYESWIVDSPMGKRIGFHEFPSQFENFYHGNTFWGQFYNQNGEVNQKRMGQFLDTGKVPFIVKGGYLTTKEFLEKYLKVQE